VTTTKKFQINPDDLEFGKPRILLVEDEPTFAKVVSRVLSDDYEVVVAADGLVASTLLTEPFDLILTDLLLPGLSGVDLLRLVRTYDLDVPMVIMTGMPSLDTAIEAVQLGALQYLVKPVDLDLLRETVSKGVALNRLARTKRAALAIASTTEARSEPLFMGDRLGLRVRFDRAMQHLRLVFQPIVDFKTRRIVAYEALMRSREDSLPSPGAVLDAAERLGLVGEVGRQVRHLAAAAMPLLPKGADLFVNIHTAELADDFLFSGGCPLVPHATRVIFEITERAAIDGVHDLPKRVRTLREMGFRIALDDLGAGYAGLSTFASLEPDIVKIDMSLIRNIQDSITKQRVVRSLVTLCREMNMRVVAEGIETSEELAVVADIGADLLQGYLLGKPAKVFSTKVNL